MKGGRYLAYTMAIFFALALVVINVAEWQRLRETERLAQAQQLLTNTVLVAALFGCAAVPLYWRQKTLAAQASRSAAILREQKQSIDEGFHALSNLLQDLEREKAQATANMLANAQLAAVVNNSADAIISFDTEGKLLTINDTARQLGLFSDPGHIRDLQHSASLAPQNLDKLLQAARHTGAQQTLQLSLDRGTELRQFSGSVVPITRAGHATAGFAMTLRDITDEQRMMERFRTAVSAAPNAMLMIDSSGNIVMANEQAQALFGYSIAELEGAGIEKLVPMDLRQKHRGFRSQFFAHPERRAMGQGRELYARHRDSSRIAVEIGLTPVALDDEMFVISAIVDISERKQHQRTLENLNRELAEKHKEMEQFIYTVSHDLKAPLVTIGGFSKRLQDRLQNDLDEKEARYLTRIVANVRLMEQLLNDLLKLSRVVKRQVEKTWIAIDPIAADVIGSLEGPISTRGATVIEPHCGLSVWANEQLLRQCLQNLLSNAINHCAVDKKPEIRVCCEETARDVQLSVIDNGPGIEPQHHQRIFDIFERLNPLDEGGTGVGLSIVKAVAEKHGGQVLLDSSPGEGSRFTVSFPKPTEREADHEQDAETVEHIAG